MPLQCKLTSQDGSIDITIPAVWNSLANQVKCQSYSVRTCLSVLSVLPECIVNIFLSFFVVFFFQFVHQLNGTVPTITLELEIQVLSSVIIPIENPNNIRGEWLCLSVHCIR